MSDDGAWAHCTRAEKAGRLELIDGSETYGHKMQGACGCGVEHEPQRPSPNGAGPQVRRRIVATYDFRDEDDKLLFQEVRYSPKDFKQRRPDGQDGWIWNLKGVALVPYRLPELLAADPSAPVYIVEGPKDADRLIKLGLLVTTNAMGAKKWKSEYNTFLAGRHVILLADADEKGRDHVRLVAQSLTGVAA